MTSTQKIACSVELAPAGTQNDTYNIGDVQRAAEQTWAKSGEAVDIANMLASQSDDLSTQIEMFLGKIKAA